MKTVVVLMLLIATVYCLPVKRSASSSESSEEHAVVQQPAMMLQKAADKLVQAETAQTTPSESNESTNSADDKGDADDESETDEMEEENETNSSESESGETQTTFSPPIDETTLDPIINTGRGDSLGYPDDYKKAIVYLDAKDYKKIPSPYKSYSHDKLGGLTIISKKMSVGLYNSQDINDVEKDIYKGSQALKVHNVLLEEEDTSTPEMEATLGDIEVTPGGGRDNDRTSAGDLFSASASQEETDSSLSNKETMATNGGTDREDDSSQSTESQESNEATTQTSERSVVIAK